MKKVCVVGLGFVGCAMATAIASAKNDDEFTYQVVGIDLDNDQGKAKVNSINSGIFH